LSEQTKGISCARGDRCFEPVRHQLWCACFDSQTGQGQCRPVTIREQAPHLLFALAVPIDAAQLNCIVSLLVSMEQRPDHPALVELLGAEPGKGNPGARARLQAIAPTFQGSLARGDREYRRDISGCAVERSMPEQN